MNHVEKLDLMGVSSLAIVAAALLVAWMVNTPGANRVAAQEAAGGGSVMLSDDGRMKLVVTADAGEARAPARALRTTAVRPAGSPSLEVVLPFAFRP